MDAEQEELQNFINLHIARIKTLPCASRAYMVTKKHGFGLHEEFTSYTYENVAAAFDTENPLVRWLIQQIRSHDPTREIVVGILFGDTPLASVIQRQSDVVE